MSEYNPACVSVWSVWQSKTHAVLIGQLGTVFLLSSPSKMYCLCGYSLHTVSLTVQCWDCEIDNLNLNFKHQTL